MVNMNLLWRRILLTGVSVAAAAALNAQPKPTVEFDVASIKPNKSTSRGSSINDSRGMWRATNVTVRSLLINAFDVLPEQIVGAPSWTESDAFDIEAKADFDP